jgi:3-oxoacyl-[acyl-carrier protein] reductase
VNVAVVTGAARGLGEAIARRLCADGFAVALCDLDAVGLEKLASELGSRARALEMDVREPGGWRNALAVATSLGDVTALVNNAARIEAGAVLEIELDEWDDVLATNLRGPFLGIREVGGHLRERGGGRIVNVASDAAFSGRGAMGAHYAASKAGLLALTRRAAAELAADGVTVNAIAPGALDGQVVRELVGEDVASVEAGIPLGRLGGPAEVAGLVSWLLSDDAGYMTGATVRIDGGSTL